MDPLITVAQYEARTSQTFAGDELAQLEALIDDATALIGDAVGEAAFLDDDDAPAVPASVIPVVVRVVQRALENPLGLDSETQGNYTWRKEGSTSSGIYLTPRDLRDVRRAVGKLSAGSVVMQTETPYPTLTGHPEGTGDLLGTL